MLTTQISEQKQVNKLMISVINKAEVKQLC